MSCFLCLALCRQGSALYTHHRVGAGLKCAACTSLCLHSGDRLRLLLTCSTAVTAVLRSACQTCLLSLNAVARSSGSTSKRYLSPGSKSSGFIISRLSRIRFMVWSYSNTDLAPGYRLKCSLLFLQVYWLCVIWIRFLMKPVAQVLAVFLLFLLLFLLYQQCWILTQSVSILPSS